MIMTIKPTGLLSGTMSHSSAMLHQNTVSALEVLYIKVYYVMYVAGIQPYGIFKVNLYVHLLYFYRTPYVFRLGEK